MAGRMGGHSKTVNSLKVIQVDAENDLILVKGKCIHAASNWQQNLTTVSGAVPGPKKGLVKIKDALRKPWPDVEPIPAHLLGEKSSESPSKAESEPVS